VPWRQIAAAAAVILIVSLGYVSIILKGEVTALAARLKDAQEQQHALQPAMGGPFAERITLIEDEMRELKLRNLAADRKQAQQLRETDAMEKRLAAAERKLDNETRAQYDLVAQAILDRVPVGAMIPYFGKGDVPPKGYVFADGRGMWPNAEWVPEHLRQNTVPNMREQLLGGTTTEADVGHVYNRGILRIPGVTIQGSSFQLPADRREELQIAAEEGKSKKGGFVGVFSPNDDYKDQMGLFWTGYGGRFDARPAVYRSFKTLERLEGSHKIPPVELALDTPRTNPRHLMCRWIIRVE
jgi:hypothetical protein